MLQKKIPNDYVVATGISKSVKDFVQEAYKYINVEIIWKGKGISEVGLDNKTKKILIKIDPYYFRPTEVNELRGDARKARRELKWKPETTFKKLVHEMVQKDIENFKNKLNKFNKNIPN
jgi:GDPmannose 4,6-dehydratase